MNYEELFNRIEELFFSYNYKGIVELWEQEKGSLKLDYNNENDDKILEAVRVSYYELKDFKRSIHYLNQQISQIEKLKLHKKEEEKKLRYYYMEKINLYGSFNKNILKYKLAQWYLINIKQDSVFNKVVSFTEELYYEKFLSFNKRLGYILVGFICLAIFYHLSDFNISRKIYNTYNILSLLVIFWLFINYAFANKMRTMFVSIFRYLFPAQSDL
jgi:hypothetical protein